ncbi:MAG: hypothetical protein K2P78_07990 [Gemmataceae bacterium]|nr:hypothetical protein [Gemmataceae bacterium]
MATKEKTCSVSRDEFHRNAKPITADIGGSPVLLEPREFSSGGFGWHASDKLTLKLANGQLVRVQAGITLAVVNSKFAPAAVLPETPKSAAE